MKLTEEQLACQQPEGCESGAESLLFVSFREAQRRHDARAGADAHSPRGERDVTRRHVNRRARRMLRPRVRPESRLDRPSTIPEGLPARAKKSRSVRDFHNFIQAISSTHPSK